MADYLVEQNPRGGWDVRPADEDEPVENRRTERRAMVAARPRIRASGGGELVVKDKLGRVRQTDTVAPPPGTARP